MQNAKYVHTLFIAVCFALIQRNDLKELSTITSEEIDISPEKLREINVTLRMGGRNNEIADESKPVRIFILEGAEFRVAFGDKKILWENASVPFEISDDYTRENRNLIFEAMNEFHNKTCVRFRPRKEEKSYILIMPGTGCSAGVGKQPQSNKVSLSENCFVKGIVIHELMHTLGFLHEQNRPDRDEFVTVMYENIQEGLESNFKKFSEDEVTLLNQTYDYGSVMHYGAFDFSKDKDKPTIIPKKEGVKIGQRDGFSEKDLIKINLLYNCNITSMDNSTAEDEGFLPFEEENKGAKRIEKLKKNPLLYFILSKLLL